MMNNKVQVQLYIPATGKMYDILLPKMLSVAQAAELLASFFAGTSGGAYLPDRDAVLCSMETGQVYHVNSSVEELHLKNGSRLMLI